MAIDILFDPEKSDSIDDIIEYAKGIDLPLDKRLGIDKMKAQIRTEMAVRNSTPAPADIASQKLVKLIIHKTDSDTGSLVVPVSVNGKTWLIKRGVEVTVPAFVVEVLENAVKDVYVQNDMQKPPELRQSPAYPFSTSAA